jgi:tetratricopeptide (TPR) repeat protein
MGKRAIEKKNLVILDMIATNNWKRPIYFSSTVNPGDYMNLQPYFQMEGMAYRLLPLRDPNYDPRSGDDGFVEKDRTASLLLKDFSYRGLQNPRIFYDENNLRFPANYRDKFARLANAYLAEGNVAQARAVANKAMAVMPDNTIPYDVYSAQLAAVLAVTGEKQKAETILDTMTQRSEQMLAYYATKPDASLFDEDQRGYLVSLQYVYMAADRIGDKARANKARSVMQQYYPQ